MNFFQRHQDKLADEIEPPGESSVVSREAENKANTIEPIHVTEAEYEVLTRALHPENAAILPELKIDLPERNTPAVADGIVDPPPPNLRAVSLERPSGTPIV